MDIQEQQGFSLLEAVVALGILSLFILPLAGILNSGMARLSDARNLAEATALLQRAVEETKLEDFDSVSTEELNPYPESSSQYYLKREVTPVVEKSSEDGTAIKQVDLGIYLIGGSPNEPLAEMEILLYRYDGI